MQSVTESLQKKKREKKMQAGKQRLEARSQARRQTRKDTLETRPVEKRNENNLVGHTQNDVTDKLKICPYFVIFNTPTYS
jgi:hypothetical protein